MSQYDVHQQLVEMVKAGMKKRGLNQMQLAAQAGVGQGNLSAILNNGKPALESTWQKLFDVVWPCP